MSRKTFLEILVKSLLEQHFKEVVFDMFYPVYRLYIYRE